MLEFERTVKAPDSNVAVHVFIDPEKGHTVYLSHTGMITVIEQEKSKSSKVRAVGFATVGSDCSSCNGC